jgi:hypothetical protein
MNQGLRRRFTFRYDIDKYTSDELLKIFELKVNKEQWALESQVTELDTIQMTEFKTRRSMELTQLFKENSKFMPNFGGDVETLFLNCKIIHGKRVLFLDQNLRKVLTITDIRNGFEKFIGNRKYKDMIDHDSEYMDISFYS